MDILIQYLLLICKFIFLLWHVLLVVVTPVSEYDSLNVFYFLIKLL